VHPQPLDLVLYSREKVIEHSFISALAVYAMGSFYFFDLPSEMLTEY